LSSFLHGLWRLALYLSSIVVSYSEVPSALWHRGLFVPVMAIYAFYKRRQNHMRLTTNANRSQYLRLMVISSIEILGTVPLGTYYIVSSAKHGVEPWKGWAFVHSHYSEVVQVAGFIWRNDPATTANLEMFRWSVVVCAFLFFALFGFAGEAREHYHCLYNTLARRLGKSTSTPHGAPLAYVIRL
jgi:pheromone a factor receptor